MISVPSTGSRRLLTLAASMIASSVAAGIFGGAAHAQTLPSGIIRGIILDAQRLPIPTATVTLRSPALQGSRSAIPREDGSYGFWQLPPGEYEIALEAPRFASVTRTAIVLQGRAVEVNVTMREEAAPGERGDLVETPASIDGPIVAAQFSQAEIDRLASPRTVATTALLAPGVTAPRASPLALAIHGALPYDNIFTMNGVDISDNLLGSPQNLFVEDAIEDTTVLTGGLPAEYGRSTGGVVNAITRSGGNRFSGSYRATLSNPSWTTETPLELCDPAVTLPTCVRSGPRPDVLDVSHEATLGGYVAKDRLWFFGAGRLMGTTDATPLPLSGAANSESSTNQRGQIKLTGALAPRQTLTFDAFTNLTTDKQHPAFGSTVDPAAVGTRTLPNYYFLGNYRAAPGKKALVEMQVSRRVFERREGGTLSRAPVDSPIVARTIAVDGSPAHYNAPYFDPSDSEHRNSLQAAGSFTYLFASRAKGRHEIKGGYEFFRSEHAGGGSQSTTGYVFDADYLTRPGSSVAPSLDASGRFIPLWTPGSAYLETWLSVPGSTLNVDTQSIYVEDHWAIGPHWSADVGVRDERARTNATGVFSNVDSHTLMPRLGTSYAIGDRGNHVLHVTYGHYAGRFDEALLGANTSVTNPNVWLGVYVGPAGQGRSFAPGFDPANYLTLGGRFPTANVSVDPALTPPLVREFTASYGVNLEGKGFLQAAYVRRDWSRLVADSISITNGTTRIVRNGFDVGTFTDVVYRNSGAAARNYDALEFQARCNPLPRWSLNGSYTLQLRNEGNYAPAGSDAPGGTTPIAQYPEAFVATRHYPDGPLPTFERHRVRAWSAYDVDLRRAGTISFSVSARIDSGSVYSLTANQPLTPVQNAALTRAGYPDRPGDQTVFFGQRGSGTFDGSGLLDVAVGYSIPAFERLRPWAKLELYDALNNRSLVAWDTTIVPDASGPVDALGLPTTFHPSTSFGKATANDDFPTPFPGATGGRTVRLQFGFRF